VPGLLGLGEAQRRHRQATAGHRDRRLKHTIRVAGKLRARGVSLFLDINTESDPQCEWYLKLQRGDSDHEVQRCSASSPPVRAGRAKVDFHLHSVEVSFSRRSIGNPRGYGWRVTDYAWDESGLLRKPDVVPDGDRFSYIRHRWG
jgi:hypothetical protein